MDLVTFGMMLIILIMPTPRAGGGGGGEGADHFRPRSRSSSSSILVAATPLPFSQGSFAFIRVVCSNSVSYCHCYWLSYSVVHRKYIPGLTLPYQLHHYSPLEKLSLLLWRLFIKLTCHWRISHREISQ